MTVTNHNPVAIGGVGGSGTRLIAQIVDRLGFYIGDVLNPALDNLYFTLLFKRPVWFGDFPSDSTVSKAIGIFRTAMTSGLSGRVSQDDIDYVGRITAQLELADLPIGADSSTAQKLLESTAPDFAGRIGWGWKEPNTHIFLPSLAAAFEGIRYIHVVRHGLDIACSKNQQQPRNWNSLICGQALDTRASLPGQSLDYWIAANRRAIRIGEELLGDRFLLLNYDNLCNAPQEGVTILANFLDIDLSHEELEALSELVAPISTGRWKQHGTAMFSDAQLDAVRNLGFEVDL